MLSNADITIYEKDTCVRHVIKGVYAVDARGQTVKKNGIQISDSIAVYIYTTEDYAPKADDVLIIGICDFEFDSSTQKSAGESMKVFRKQYPDFAVVKSVSDYKFGGLPHIEITAR